MVFELWNDLRFRLRALFRRADVERELNDELQDHIAREAEKLERSGMSRDAAVRAARVAFGGVDRVKEDSRDARGVRFLEHVAQDVRYALRGIRSRPAFTGVVIATLGLGGDPLDQALDGLLENQHDSAARQRKRRDRLQRVDHLRNRVVHGNCVRPVRAHTNHVSPLSSFERPDLFVEAERPGAGDGAHFQRGRRRQGLRIQSADVL